MDNAQFGTAPAPIPPPPIPGQIAPQPQIDAGTAQQIKNGASWFYWIAALSLVNTGAAMLGSTWRFLLGLEITSLVDAIAHELGSVAQVAGVVIGAVIAGFFVMLGLFANKYKGWAFILGMLLFALDGAVGLLIPDWIGIAFHAYALFMIFRGYSALRTATANV